MDTEHAPSLDFAAVECSERAGEQLAQLGGNLSLASCNCCCNCCCCWESDGEEVLA